MSTLLYWIGGVVLLVVVVALNRWFNRRSAREKAEIADRMREW